LPSLSTVKGQANNRSFPSFPARSGGGVWLALTLYRKGGDKQPFVSPSFPVRTGGGV